MFNLLRKIQRNQGAAESEKERDQGRGDERATRAERATAHSSTVTDRDARATEENADSDGRLVPLDQLFGTLSNHRRRQVLRVLTETDQITLGDLAEQLAAKEHDKPRAQLTSQERKRCYVSLYQVHLPKLADVDAIIYDKSRGTVEPGPTLHEFTYYLPDESESAQPKTHDRRWTAYIPDILN